MAGILKKYTDEYDKLNKSALNSQITTVQKAAEKNRNIVNQNYGAQIAETEQAYDDQERINAVQKLINEQEVAENMANLGLTDSGLNRTQQTAVQLSYANNRANIERQKRSAVDSLTREMNAYLTEIETGAESSIASLKDTYNQNRTSYAQSMYKTDVEAAAKAAKENTPKLTKLDYGTLAGTAYGSDGNVVYTDSSGNKVTMRKGANPYTNTTNKDIYDDEGKPTKVFSNGYQPDNYNGKKLKKYEPSKGSSISSKTTVTWRNDGVEQQVFTTGNDKYYIWYGPENRYVEARYNPFREEWEVNLG